MLKHKGKLKALTAELSFTKKQLDKANYDLETSRTFEAFCWDRYVYYMQKCEALERENKSLRRENKKLELSIQAFKTVWEAHKNYIKKGDKTS